MEYIKIVDGIIKKHACGDVLPEGYTKVDAFYGITETKASWYNLPAGTRISDKELIKKGIREDNRGVYYDTKTKDVVNVAELDKPVPAGTTKLKPSKTTDIWKAGKWVIDLQKEVNLTKEGVKPAMKSVLSDMDIRASQHKEQLELIAVDPTYKTDLTKAQYIQLLKDKETIRQLSKKSILCIEGITTEQGLLDAIELFKTDFTKMTEVKRVLKEVERRLKLLGVK